MSHTVKNYREQGGAKWVVGGELDVIGSLKMAGDEVTFRAGITADMTGTEEIDTGLSEVVSVIATLTEDPALAEATYVSADIPTQTGADAGKFTLKTWKPTALDDVTPAAGTGDKKVSWLAVGKA